MRGRKRDSPDKSRIDVKIRDFLDCGQAEANRRQGFARALAISLGMNEADIKNHLSAASRAPPKFESYGMAETAAFRGRKAQDAIEWFHGIGRLGRIEWPVQQGPS
jgi:hypothetical protein